MTFKSERIAVISYSQRTKPPVLCSDDIRFSGSNSSLMDFQKSRSRTRTGTDSYDSSFNANDDTTDDESSSSSNISTDVPDITDGKNNQFSDGSALIGGSVLFANESNEIDDVVVGNVAEIFNSEVLSTDDSYLVVDPTMQGVITPIQTPSGKSVSNSTRFSADNQKRASNKSKLPSVPEVVD